MARPLQDFGRVLSAVFRFARAASYGVIALLAIGIVWRVVEVVRAAGDVHPLLGIAVLLAVGLAFAWLVGRPVVRFLRVPVVLTPPVLPEATTRTPRDMARHLLFVERYVESVGRNPEWGGDPAAVAAAASSCRALRADAERAAPADLPALEERMAALERGTVAALLAPLDRKASDAIRAESVGIGIATAVSPNGTIDAFLVLWRACNLVSRVATIYYGRPGARGTLRVLRDVSMATVASAYLQDLTDMAGSMIGAVAGKTAGALAGPVLDGSLNAIGMLRIGYLAKARCRSFSAWTERTRADAVKGALSEAGHLAKGVVSDLVRTVGGGILRLPGKILAGLTSAVAALFRPPEPDPADA